MNPYPAEQSVLVMDNCRIHHSEVLKDTLNSEGEFFYLFLYIVLTEFLRNHDPLLACLLTRYEPHRRVI